MRWRGQGAEFGPGFDPGDFITMGNLFGDPEGVRTIQMHFRPEGEVQLIQLTLDPEGLVCDLWVVCSVNALGYLRMRLRGQDDTHWVALTDSPDTTWKFPGLQGQVLNVELEATIPPGSGGFILEPQEWLLRTLWDKPQVA